MKMKSELPSPVPSDVPPLVPSLPPTAGTVWQHDFVSSKERTDPYKHVGMVLKQVIEKEQEAVTYLLSLGYRCIPPKRS